MRLVIGIALRNKRKLQSYDKMDVIQDGIIGLITAIDKFDLAKGVALSTYAVPWIKRSIGRGIADNDSLIRRPIRFINLRHKYNKIINYCKQNGDPIPKDEDLIVRLKTTREGLQLLKDDYKLYAKSLDEKIDKEDKNSETLGEIVGSEDHNCNDLHDVMVDNELMAYLKNSLSDYDYYVLYHRVLSREQRSQESIGSEFGITRKAINMKETRLKAKLEHLYDSSHNFIGYNSRDLHRSLDIENIKLEPTEPISIAKYLYLKDRFNEKERIALKELFCSDRKNFVHYLAKTLCMNIYDVKALLESIAKRAMDIIEEEKNNFNLFHLGLVITYGSKIFSVGEDLNIADVLIPPEYPSDEKNKGNIKP